MSALFRKGDIVTIEATIASTPFNMDDGNAKVKIEFPPYHDAYVDPAQLKMVRPRFEVGDVVDLVAPGQFGSLVRGEVKAIDGDSLWVKRQTGDLTTWEISRVRRADPDEPQAADPDPVEPPPAPSNADAEEAA